MSEAATSTTPDGPSAGTLLRQAREAAGLHVDTLAANLKVPVRKLQALEDDRYDLLPDSVFVRALASSVCRTLKVDPQPVLARLPQTTQPRLVLDTEAINAPFRAPSDGPQPGVLDQLTRPVVLTVLALLLGALVLVFLPLAQPDGGQQPQQVTTATPGDPVLPPPGAAATPAPESQSVPASTIVVTPANAPAAPLASSVAPAPAAPGAAPMAAMPSPPVAAAPAAAAATPASAAASVPAPAPADGIVVFRTRGPSWVQVTDATGATVLRRLMAAGETAAANGKLPLSVTVGDAGQTEVQVRGQPYDLRAQASDNVARFEVK